MKLPEENDVKGNGGSTVKVAKKLLKGSEDGEGTATEPVATSGANEEDSSISGSSREVGSSADGGDNVKDSKTSITIGKNINEGEKGTDGHADCHADGGKTEADEEDKRGSHPDVTKDDVKEDRVLSSRVALKELEAAEERHRRERETMENIVSLMKEVQQSGNMTPVPVREPNEDAESSDGAQPTSIVSSAQNSMKELVDLLEKEKGAKGHLVVMAHGLAGAGTDFQNMADMMRKSYSAHGVVVLQATSYEGKTTEGVDICGQLLCQEVQTALGLTKDKKEKEEKESNADGAAFTYISFIGHSLGGLICRFACGLLRELGTFINVQPVNFITLATPHLGTRRPQHKQKLNSIINYFTASWWLGKTGRQLVYEDSKHPLLVLLAEPHEMFWQALGRFRRRVLYSNVYDDLAVPYSTAAIAAFNPYRIQNELSDNINYPVILNRSRPVSVHDDIGDDLFERTSARIDAAAFAAMKEGTRRMMQGRTWWGGVKVDGEAKPEETKKLQVPEAQDAEERRKSKSERNSKEESREQEGEKVLFRKKTGGRLSMSDGLNGDVWQDKGIEESLQKEEEKEAERKTSERKSRESSSITKRSRDIKRKSMWSSTVSWWKGEKSSPNSEERPDEFSPEGDVTDVKSKEELSESESSAGVVGVKVKEDGKEGQRIVLNNADKIEKEEVVVAPGKGLEENGKEGDAEKVGRERENVLAREENNTTAMASAVERRGREGVASSSESVESAIGGKEGKSNDGLQEVVEEKKEDLELQKQKEHIETENNNQEGDDSLSSLTCVKTSNAAVENSGKGKEDETEQRNRGEMKEEGNEQKNSGKEQEEDNVEDTKGFALEVKCSICSKKLPLIEIDTHSAICDPAPMTVVEDSPKQDANIPLTSAVHSYLAKPLPPHHVPDLQNSLQGSVSAPSVAVIEEETAFLDPTEFGFTPVSEGGNIQRMQSVQGGAAAEGGARSSLYLSSQLSYWSTAPSHAASVHSPLKGKEASESDAKAVFIGAVYQHLQTLEWERFDVVFKVSFESIL